MVHLLDFFKIATTTSSSPLTISFLEVKKSQYSIDNCVLFLIEETLYIIERGRNNGALLHSSLSTTDNMYYTVSWRTPDKEVWPNPFMLAWVTNVLSDPI
jgi:hypothetical protein